MNETTTQSIDDLPDIPGGWTHDEVTIGNRSYSLVRPSVPDKFLDDAGVIAANQESDYMPYWSYLWPSARPMSAALDRAGWNPDTEILEIGCGVGLVGLVALAHGWRVTFSDYDDTALNCAMHNARVNGFGDKAESLRLDWREPIDRQWPVIIGCEVTYEPKFHSALLDLVEKMLTPDGVCWIGDPGRIRTTEFYSMAQDRGFRTCIWNEGGERASFPSSGQFQLIELRQPID